MKEKEKEEEEEEEGGCLARDDSEEAADVELEREDSDNPAILF